MQSKVNYFDFILNYFSISYFISNAQLKAIFEAYGNFSKKDIEADIKSETSGNLCKGLLAIGNVINDIYFTSYNSNFFSSSYAKSTWFFRLSTQKST